jgi:hypothetical protein
MWKVYGMQYPNCGRSTSGYVGAKKKSAVVLFKVICSREIAADARIEQSKVWCI